MMPRSGPPIVGIDFRPALFSCTGIGRYTHELVRAIDCLGRDDVKMMLYGDAWRKVAQNDRITQLLSARKGVLRRRRIPGRLAPVLSYLGMGVERRLGGIDLFHLTDLALLPVRRAVTVVTVHDLAFEIDSAFHGRAFRRDVPGRLRAAVARAARVIVPSHETARQLRLRYSVVEDRIHVVPHGCDHMRDRTREASADELERLLARHGVERPYALCVGTIEPRKNHDVLLDAFRLFARRNSHTLVLVGGFGWMCDGLRDRLAHGRERGRVRHMENLDDRFLPPLYREAQWSIYPSLYEGFGLPVLESMACGTPAITTRRGALEEVGGDAVRYVDPEDPEEMAKAMAELSDDAELRAEMSEAGAERAGGFGWARAAQSHLEVYRAVASEIDAS
ncbi:MAG: glycosyl transferase family 1 [Gemmatimonadetes bacterium]|nr:glycosyl transferase family 1 [Gemmatimonadota bacterium]